jgi:hypothetical protein
MCAQVTIATCWWTAQLVGDPEQAVLLAQVLLGDTSCIFHTSPCAKQPTPTGIHCNQYSTPGTKT